MNWPRPLDDDPNLLRNKLATKESQLAAQQTDLLKRAEQLDELKNTLNETLHKLNQEVTNGVNLENILAKCRDDLQTEKLVSQNAVAARDAAQDKLKEKELDMRGLESNLESLSHTSNSTNARTLKLEKEKSILENRIRELEANLRQLSSPAPTATPARSRAPSRRRSSSVSDTRVITLEQDLKDTRASLAQKDADLRAASTKLAQTQTDLVRIENEKVVADKRLQAQIHDLQAALQEKEEELVYFQDQQGGSREEELLQRIDEDETKIAALERLLSEAPQTQVQVQRMEQQLLEASERIVDMEGRNIELVREKEEALDEIDDARAQITQLSDAVRERDAFIAKQREIPPRPSEEDVSRLLAAIDRIRGERDNLRRDVEFLQNEARFTEEALRSRIAALEQTAQSPQLQAEVLCLQEQLAKSTEHEQTILVQKNKEIRRVGRVAMASAVIIEHLRSQMGVTAQQFLNASTASEGACGRLREADLQFSATPLRRQQSGDLHTRQLMFDTSDGDNTQVRLVQLESQVEELSHTLDDITAERDALNLQTTNLARDLETAQRDIAEGETRYTELQFHQLSSMTVNAATEALRRQLADQEQRVLRRTELVGILQHDNQRIATNMKLQEERLMELTSELEVLAAQKEAMVEDCAEARHARDGAIGRVDELEVEMEAVERRAVDADGVIQTMVGVVMATVARSRRTLQRIQQAAEQTRQDLHSEIQHLNEQLALKDRLITENDLEGEIARLRVAHVEEMGDLQRRLVELTSAVEEAQARCDAAEENYRQALSDSTRSRREFENAAGDAEEHANSLNAELTRLRDQHAEVLRELRDQLASATADAQRAQADRDALDGVHQRVLKQLAEAREGSETRLQELDDRVAELDSQLEEQTSRCEALSEEVDALRDQVQGEMDLRAAEKTRLDTAVQNAIGQRERAESVLEDIRRELSAATEELALARSEIHAAEGEKTELQEEVTLLQAEKQRSLSLHRYLESQVKEKEQLIAALTAEIEQSKAQFTRVDKACKAAEVNLSLQGAQHRREVSELQRQVATLKAQPDLQAMVVDLEESNRDKDELLKRKNAELEEYDDRAIEILTNNKKLTEKVEALTRKMQKLQAKLDAAKATVPQRESPPSMPALAHPRPRTNTFSSIGSAAPSISSLPSVSSMSSSMSMPTVPPVPPIPSHIPRSPVRSRIASGSALPRPKTPERKAIPPVFRAKTPERLPVFIPPSPSAPVLGQKRRAPDDFENVHVPTQGFTADSLPDVDGTPRMRRGFTPVRRTEPSPRMGRSATHIADVTNSPRLDTTAKAKRSWLGRIKGTTTTGRPPSREL